MMHKMKLKKSPFELIKSGTKTIELRLNDEKRQLIKVGDLIEFTNIITNETLTVKVINLYYFDSFKELYKNFDKIDLGYRKDEEASYTDMEQYYSKEKQEKYGVVGIHVEKI